MKTFSKDWTDEERLKIISILAGQIQMDIPAGNYGAATDFNEKGLPTKFRPNMQSIMNVIFASKEELEAHRTDLESLVPEEEREAFSEPLEKTRQEAW